VARRWLIPLACAAAALVTGAIGAIVSLQTERWKLSGLIRLWDALPLAGLARLDDRTFPMRGISGHYDGAFFYAIARDPLATGEVHRLLPQAPYDWGHPAYGWVAWLVSGGGRPSAVPAALVTVALVCFVVAGAAGSLLASALGWSPWGGLVVALNPGLLFAVYSDTSETLGAALLLLALFAYVHGRRVWSIVLLAALCLDKEPLVLVPLALAGWEFVRFRRVSATALAVLPAGLWWCYVRLQLGAFPFGQGSERLTAPIVGWEQGLVAAAKQSWSLDPNATQLGEAGIALIVAFGGAIVIGCASALRLRNAVAPSFLALAVLYACIAPIGVQYPKDLVRETALIILLLPFVLFASAVPAEERFGRKYPRAPRPSRPQPES
jgi:hypothetical protein